MGRTPGLPSYIRVRMQTGIGDRRESYVSIYTYLSTYVTQLSTYLSSHVAGAAHVHMYFGIYDGNDGSRFIYNWCCMYGSSIWICGITWLPAYLSQQPWSFPALLFPYPTYITCLRATLSPTSPHIHMVVCSNATQQHAVISDNQQIDVSGTDYI